MALPAYLSRLRGAVIFEERLLGNHADLQYDDYTVTIDKDTAERIPFVIAPNGSQSLTFVTTRGVTGKLHLIVYARSGIDLNLEFRLADASHLDIIYSYISFHNQVLKTRTDHILGENSTLKINTGIVHGGACELDERFELAGSGANLKLELLDVASGSDRATIRQNVLHDNQATVSQIDNRLIAGHLARLDYEVTGHIAKASSKSRCVQDNRGLLLGEKSVIQVEPKLLIDEFDVEARHGAAIGQVNEEEMFYMQSRGLSENEAKKLIVSGYVEPYLDKITDSKLARVLRTRIASKIAGGK